MGPVSSVEPSELWLKLSEPTPSEVVDFPRKDRAGNPIGKIRIQVLKMEDHNKARLLATKALKETAKKSGIGELDKGDLESDAVREVLGDLIAHELLCMACYGDKEIEGLEDKNGNPTYPKVFANPAAIGSVLTADETLVLFRLYQMVQYKYGPFEMTMNEPGDVDAWLQRLKEGGSAFPLAALSLPQLAELTLSLSERISLVYQILESHHSSLPPTLTSDLTDCFPDMFLSGEQQSSYIQTLEVTSPKTVSLDAALRLAQEHKNSASQES
jgi:hypothetical protein